MDRFSNINNIIAFVTVAKEGSVSRAADVLNLTQPAISHQIKKLSEETGIKLFARTATGLQITHDGTAMLGKAEQVLEALAEFRQSASQRVGRVSGKLTMGTIVDPEFIRLGRLLAHLREDYPDIQTELVHGVSGDVLKWLKQGRVDAGFYLCGPEELTDVGFNCDEPLHAIKLADFSYRVIAPAGWQQQVENADRATLASLPWIGTPETSVHYRLLEKVFEDIGSRPNVVARVDQEPSMLEMVRSGIGLSLCRESIALHQKHTIGLAVCKSVSIPACLCFVALERRKNNPVISEVFNLLDRAW